MHARAPAACTRVHARPPAKRGVAHGPGPGVVTWHWHARPEDQHGASPACPGHYASDRPRWSRWVSDACHKLRGAALLGPSDSARIQMDSETAGGPGTRAPRGAAWPSCTLGPVALPVTVTRSSMRPAARPAPVATPTPCFRVAGPGRAFVRSGCESRRRVVLASPFRVVLRGFRLGVVLRGASARTRTRIRMACACALCTCGTRGQSVHSDRDYATR